LNRFHRQLTDYPGAIIISEDVGKEVLTDLHNVIESNPILKQIPFLFCCRSQKSYELNKQKFHYLDDAISTINTTSKDILLKINFLKKIKERTLSNLSSTSPTIAIMHPFLYNFDYIIRHILDLLIATTVLAILSPILLLTALIIKLESKGPIFYSSYRAGQGYRVFKFYKFRSMVYDAADRIKGLENQYKDITAQGPIFFKVANDPRITKFGAFLRRTSLDELPQLINVLKGDMSLVGNRPLPLYEAATLTTDKYAMRFLAPAGITGLWQINKRGKEDMSAAERVNLDIAYANHHSFWYDLKIMCKTPFSMGQKVKV